MALARRFQREEVGAECCFVRRSISPESASCLPRRSKPLFIEVAVLDDEGTDSFRMFYDHPHANWHTIVLHKKGIGLQTQRLCKCIHRRRNLIEGVVELCRSWCIA